MTKQKSLNNGRIFHRKFLIQKTHKKKGPLGDILNLQIGIILVNKYPSPAFSYSKAAVRKKNSSTGY